MKDEKGMKRVEKFLKEDICPECAGTRLSEVARAPTLRGISLDEACRLSLRELGVWVEGCGQPATDMIKSVRKQLLFWDPHAIIRKQLEKRCSQ